MSDEAASPVSRVLKIVAWVLESFGPLLAFWGALRLAGLVPAIIVSIVTAVILVAWTIVRDRRVSPFTAFIAVSVVIFGVLDLKYRTGFFVKLEPAIGNSTTGLFFLGSILWRRPLLIELAEKSIGRPLPNARRYLTGWTAVWSIFFFVRAAVFVWMAYNVELERAIIIRGVAGPISFGAMFLIEMITRRVAFLKKTETEPALAKDTVPNA